MSEVLVGQIVAASLCDELEKIAGLPRAVAEGGGGTYGALLRKAQALGKKGYRAERAQVRKVLEERRPSELVFEGEGRMHDVAREGAKIKSRARTLAGGERRSAPSVHQNRGAGGSFSDVLYETRPNLKGRVYLESAKKGPRGVRKVRGSR